jgi:hypothetical protein
MAADIAKVQFSSSFVEQGILVLVNRPVRR